MTTSQRRMRIFDIIQDNKSVEVNNLAKMFSVSTMTIRRDLAIFEKQGLITTNYGGAYLNQGTSMDASFSLKSGQRIGTQGLELERGATVADFTECNIKRTMLQAGKVKILLADHNKLGQTFLVKQADVDEFDYIVTDNQSDPTYLQRIRDLGVTVYVAE